MQYNWYLNSNPNFPESTISWWYPATKLDGGFDLGSTDTVTMTFSGPDGGFPDVYFVGSFEDIGVGVYPCPAVAAMPTVVTALNASGVDPVVLCADVSWSSQIQRDETFSGSGLSNTNPQTYDSLTDTASRTGSFSGSLTSFLSGVEETVNGTTVRIYDNQTAATELTSSGDSILSWPQIWGGYDTTSGLMMVAIFESIFRTSYSYTSPGETIFSSTHNSIESKFLLEVVEDAGTQNPWVLEEQTVLKQVMDGIISDHFLTSSPGEKYFLDLDASCQHFVF